MEEVFMNSSHTRLLCLWPQCLLFRPSRKLRLLTQEQSNATGGSQTTQSTDSMNGTGKQPLQAPAREGFWGRVNPFRPQELREAPDRSHPRPRQRT